MEKLSFYSALGKTPKEAQRTIGAGKLKGMTDINPMFRIKRMTEVFGAQGIGWYFDNVNYWTTEAAGEQCVWCSLELYVKVGDEWSRPINGIGGSKLCGKGVGDGINDEAYKMAFTDAQSIAMKGLGMCADIYYQKDRTRYNLAEDKQSDTPIQSYDNGFSTDANEAFADCMNNTDIKVLGDLYNNKYGGNKCATKEIKSIFANRLVELQNQNGGQSNAKTA